MQRRRVDRIRHHPFVIPVTTFLLLFFITMVVFIALNGQTMGADDTHVVQLSIDGKQQTLPTRATTVGDLLKRLNINMGAQDITEPPADTPILEDNFKINLYHAKPVTVVDGNHKTSLLTALTNPRAVAEKAGSKLLPEDRAVIKGNDDLVFSGDIGQQIIIDRALSVKLSLYGQTVGLRTHAKTVGQLLKERNLDPNNITVYPAPTTILKNDDLVFVTDPGRVVQLEEVEIPQGQSYVDDFNLAAGSTKVNDPGKPGKKVIVYDTPKDHPEQKRVLQEVPVVDPINAVIARGRKVNTASVAGDKAALMAAAGISSEDYVAVDFIISHESGWKPGSVSRNGCYGLGQACPGSKVVNSCPDWSNNPVCQLKFFTGYAQRYGGWQRAYFVWQTQGWW